MVSFRLSEDEYASLINICEVEGARSISDLARAAVSRLVHKPAPTHIASQNNIELALRDLAGRVETLDLQLRQLSTSGNGSARTLEHNNGKI
jgi:hypothetical protein